MQSVRLPDPHCNYGELFSSLWENLKVLEGDVAEFGVYRGGTSRQLATLTGRKVYAFDTFEGIPKEDFTPNLDQDEPGKFEPTLTVEEMFKDYPTVVPVIGRFEDTLPTLDPTVKFVLVYLDADLYTSTKQVLGWIPPYLIDGAIMVFDDYGSHQGVKKAVDEFCKEHSNIVPTRTVGSSFCITWKDN